MNRIQRCRDKTRSINSRARVYYFLIGGDVLARRRPCLHSSHVNSIASHYTDLPFYVPHLVDTYARRSASKTYRHSSLPFFLPLLCPRPIGRLCHFRPQRAELGIRW